MPEQESEHEYLVRIPTFGDPEKTQREALLHLSRACHAKFKGKFTITDPQGREWRYNPKGDDMGNHPDEHEALIPVPVTSE